MRAIVLAVLASLALVASGCIWVPRRGVVVAPVPGVVVRPHLHVHGPSCGHFWGYYGAHPVYFDDGRYTYWDGRAWTVFAGPPGHLRRHHHHHGRPPPVVHGAVPP